MFSSLSTAAGTSSLSTATTSTRPSALTTSATSLSTSASRPSALTTSTTSLSTATPRFASHFVQPGEGFAALVIRSFYERQLEEGLAAEPVAVLTALRSFDAHLGGGSFGQVFASAVTQEAVKWFVPAKSQSPEKMLLEALAGIILRDAKTNPACPPESMARARPALSALVTMASFGYINIDSTTVNSQPFKNVVNQRKVEAQHLGCQQIVFSAGSDVDILDFFPAAAGVKVRADLMAMHDLKVSPPAQLESPYKALTGYSTEKIAPTEKVRRFCEAVKSTSQGPEAYQTMAQAFLQKMTRRMQPPGQIVYVFGVTPQVTNSEPLQTVFDKLFRKYTKAQAELYARPTEETLLQTMRNPEATRKSERLALSKIFSYLRKVLTIVADLESCVGFEHRDLSLNNVLVQNYAGGPQAEKIFFIDLGDMKIKPHFITGMGRRAFAATDPKESATDERLLTRFSSEETAYWLATTFTHDTRRLAFQFLHMVFNRGEYIAAEGQAEVWQVIESFAPPEVLYFGLQMTRFFWDDREHGVQHCINPHYGKDPKSVREKVREFQHENAKLGALLARFMLIIEAGSEGMRHTEPIADLRELRGLCAKARHSVHVILEYLMIVLDCNRSPAWQTWEKEHFSAAAVLKWPIFARDYFVEQSAGAKK